MCGIFGYIGKETNAAEIVLDGLKNLEYRGYDSWGIAVVPVSGAHLRSQNHVKVAVKKRVGKIGTATVDDLAYGSIAIGHTRWATHGGVTEKNAHPHLDENKSIALVHNGIIENYLVLKASLLKKNHTFISDTDSEIAVHLIEEYARTKPFGEAVRLAFCEFEGLNAIIAFSNKDTMVVGARNGSPLVVGKGINGNFIASDASAILPHTRSVYFIEDNELITVSERKIILREAKTGRRKTISYTRLPWKREDGSLGKYPHYMLKEIYDQPTILRRIATHDSQKAIQLAQEIESSHGTYFVGCGTAAYACMAGSYIFSSIAKRHVNWAVASEFGFQLEFLNEKSFVLALSQSGETMDTIEAIKKSRNHGARIGALVNVEGSTLFRMVDTPFALQAGTEKGVATTKAFSAKIAQLILTAGVLANDLTSGKKALKRAARSVSALLKEDGIKRIKDTARVLKSSEHIFVIGRGLSYPTSLEASLKIKEITYIHAEGFAAGELKHGVIALIGKGTPRIVFASKDDTYAENISAAFELRARGGFIIGISEEPHAIFDVHIPVMSAGIATIIPNVVVSQLLAYYLALEKGCDPDKPRNLAKSVTVK